ncbi:hypothetical protein WN944_012677 [Citrus x changshan-huyou]|uniref:HMA domain-containing protein n=1 Tax=Citrus x changshan-huyou TaxID=2935761 RepID=A0AAP0N1Z1_9ROSI
MLFTLWQLQVTTMVLKVDLQCSKCYKKVKKVLSKFPQIQDQIYDEKQNKVTIKVVCCCPEKMRDKICCKGDGVIKSIEIKSPDDQKKKKEEPADKKEPEKKKETPQTEKKKEKAEESKPKNKEPAPEKGKEKDQPEKKKEPKDTPKPKVDPQPKVDPPAPGYPPPYYPFGVCCPECYGGHGGGPCHRYGPPPKIWYDGYYGRPVYDSWGGSSKYYGYRSDCLSEENPSACAII